MGISRDPHAAPPLRVQAKNILIAVGGRAFRAPIEGAEHAITSDDILVLPKVAQPLKS